MRHNDTVNNLGRKSAHRKAMLSNMATSLILHKRIRTTVAKAKALRVFIEPILTKSKDDTTHARRLVFNYLQDKKAVNELFREVSPKIAERQGGYTRILKLGNRVGDAAEMCYIELVDFNENMLTAKAAAETKTTRRGGRRGTKSKTEGKAPAAKKAKAAEAAPAEAAPAEEPVKPKAKKAAAPRKAKSAKTEEASRD